MDARHAQNRHSEIANSKVVLATGGVISAVLAVLAVLVQPWLAVAVFVVALAAGVIAVVLNARAMEAASEVAADDAARALDAAVATEQRHHRESMGIIVRFTARISALRATIDALTEQLDQARHDLEERETLVAGLRSTQATLMDNAAELRARVVELEERIALREQELEQLMSEADEADILVLPRRLQITGRATAHGTSGDAAEAIAN